MIHVKILKHLSKNADKLIESKKGITLMEMLIYIGMVAVVVPGMIIFLTQTQQIQTSLAARSQMNQFASIFRTHLMNEITKADNINITSSILDVNNSVLVYTNDNGETVTIDTIVSTENFHGTEQSVRRLRVTRGSDPAEWLSDRNLQINKWRVEAVRDAYSDLTGIRWEIEITMLNPETSAYRKASFGSTHVIDILPSVSEI